MPLYHLLTLPALDFPRHLSAGMLQQDRVEERMQKIEETLSRMCALALDLESALEHGHLLCSSVLTRFVGWLGLDEA